ncbi:MULTISPECIES: MCE family protein [unclassified Nocardioides]|uniref:MCE family protein n=1 Tax=unclassified Nocardioides TaxID=2615069 RepID=UPI0006FF82E3|nr:MULTISPECIES: MlaD family protein [unclassified Nocardioides]KQY56835.1 virulence factor Mce [Nocardioides sp. Root140]KQZ66969.1 virulence factor Mce [Nocardioides sp. Root151]KRF12956.1 virulence factor Mce [Nocardioides sp. Soil796]
MITRRTKVQLVIFVIITLLGVSFVGARYARLDRVLFDRSYTVVAHFDDSGGIFAGAEVSYRGVTIGRVEKMVLTDDGVDVHLDIENKWDKIPSDTLALVGNRSAVGEQYVELQPKVDEGPYLKDDSEIDRNDTRLPIPTAQLLGDLSATVNSVDQDDLRTVVSELGTAFDGTGEDLGQIIDTSNSFIETANENFDLTTALIKDANTVLTGQLSKASAIRNFSKNLQLFSTTLAGSDKDLRTVIDTGSGTANELRTFIEENQVDIASLLNNLRTTGEVVVANLDGVEHVLSIYPYIVESGFTVVDKDPETGRYDAHFGLILTPHQICHNGYEGADKHSPFDREKNRPLNTSLGCRESADKSNARGAQNLHRAPASYDAPVVGTYDSETGNVEWLDKPATLTADGSLAPRGKGKESWTWLMLSALQNAE